MTKGDGKGANAASAEGIISRRAAGLCFDFCLNDAMKYVAGTEDGPIHMCSCSYNEQHLESYFGHSGAVYRLRWSPHCPNTFLSCSADWTIKLWNQERAAAVFTFQPTTDYGADVCWSPTNSTVFASVTGNGRVDLWDVAVNTLDPVKSLETGKRLSSVAFAADSPGLVTGDASGAGDVYQLTGALAEPTGRTPLQQQAELEKVTATVQLA